ncbi:MAG: DUF368 domain-containing protein [Gemmatimonadetes bacterium]|nr:DUF368 domain-containing protein [Gemmatimonadota bacterium]MYG23121.1 DUF368 domain-containing protein [Gemmatimonadota bacterium]MYJ38559.1 DUF368 domain-containing protein [Gemmatimonadota bacterium]
MRHWLGVTLRGLCMGTADVVPGVSGGTMALILGLYPRLIDAVGNLGVGMLRRLRTRTFWALTTVGLKDPARLRGTAEGTDAARLLLLASLAAGVLPAIAAGSRFLPPLLGNYPAQMSAFFLGLVLASVAVPFRELERRGPSRWLLALAATGVTAWFVGLPEASGGRARGMVTLVFDPPPVVDVALTPSNLTLRAPEDGTRPDVEYGLGTTVTVPAGAGSVEVEAIARMAGTTANVPPGSIREAEGPFESALVVQAADFANGRDPALVYVFLGGVLAISAMALPGVSGAFVLLLLGLYEFMFFTLWTAISYRDPEAVVVVGIFVASLVIGLLSVVRILKHLFTRWRDGTLAVLVGLMLGSVRKLWPFTDYSTQGREVLTLPAWGDPDIASVAIAFAAGLIAVLVLDGVGRRLKRSAAH